MNSVFGKLWTSFPSEWNFFERGFHRSGIFLDEFSNELEFFEQVSIGVEFFGRVFHQSGIFLDEVFIGVESFWTRFHRSGIFNLLSVSFSSALLLSQALLVTIFYDMYLS